MAQISVDLGHYLSPTPYEQTDVIRITNFPTSGPIRKSPESSLLRYHQLTNVISPSLLKVYECKRGNSEWGEEIRRKTDKQISAIPEFHSKEMQQIPESKHERHE